MPKKRTPEEKRKPHNIVGEISRRDGMPERQDGENIRDYENRLKAFAEEANKKIDAACKEIRISILTAFIRHLYEGYPAETFFYANDEGLTVCDHTIISSWARNNVDEYRVMKPQIDMAMKACESRWIMHLGNMVSGRSGGNIKALELYMKRFFKWDVDTAGQEEARAACEVFRKMAEQVDIIKAIPIE